MKVKLLQYPVHLGSVEQNLSTFLPRIADDAEGELSVFVLPEMWANGFDYRNMSLHAARTPEILEKIANSISEKTLVVANLAEQDGDHIYNTTFALCGGDVIARYRKNFLFAPMKEDTCFTRGDVPTALFRFGDVTFGMHTCYEIRFPELFRMSAYAGAEAFLVPAIWPEEKKEHWLTLIRARAIENQCYIAGGNTSAAINGEKSLECGYSGLFDPWGAPSCMGGVGEFTVECRIRKETVADVRTRIPSLADAVRAFTIRTENP